MIVWTMQNPLINGKTGITLTMMKNTMRMKKISLISMSGIAVLVNMKEKPYQRYLLMNFGKKENFIVLETILFDLIDNEFNLPFGYQLIKIAV